MSKLDEIKRELFAGENAGKVSAIASSAEGRSVGRMIDGAALKKAAESGDKEALGAMLGKVLATPEGKELVRKVSESFGEKK